MTSTGSVDYSWKLPFGTQPGGLVPVVHATLSDCRRVGELLVALCGWFCSDTGEVTGNNPECEVCTALLAHQRPPNRMLLV